MDYIIQTEKLSKVYKGQEANNNISISIKIIQYMDY